jgi:hypothetical protein
MFVLSAGADTILGGDGFDCIVLSGATAGVRVNLDSPNQGTNIATGQTYVSIEGIIGSDFSDHLIGNAADNRIEGRDGNDKLFGAGGRTACSAAMATICSTAARVPTFWTAVSGGTGPATAIPPAGWWPIWSFRRATPATRRATAMSGSRTLRARAARHAGRRRAGECALRAGRQ